MDGKLNICWITADYMLQVDLPLLKYLKADFDIKWNMISFNSVSARKSASEYALENSIDFEIVRIPYREIDPRYFFKMRRLIKKWSEEKYDLYYFDISTFPWLLPLIKQYLPTGRVILAMHHGWPHSGMRFKPLYFPYLKYLNKQDLYLQYFSEYQSTAFKGSDEGKKYVIPLALNNFGNSEKKPSGSKVVFTYFGNIIVSKNLPLLIEAANQLWETHPNRFIVRIYGYTGVWDKEYAHLIRYPEAFEINIRRIGDEEIPDLFCSSHYLMLPYKSVTQSGPLRIAYGYNVPVVTSDLIGFKESVVEGTTGFMFESENLQSLVDIMTDIVESHPGKYETVRDNMKKYVDSNMTVKTVCGKYKKMFEDVIKRIDK